MTEDERKQLRAYHTGRGAGALGATAHRMLLLTLELLNELELAIEGQGAFFKHVYEERGRFRRELELAKANHPDRITAAVQERLLKEATAALARRSAEVLELKKEVAQLKLARAETPLVHDAERGTVTRTSCGLLRVPGPGSVLSASTVEQEITCPDCLRVRAMFGLLDLRQRAEAAEEQLDEIVAALRSEAPSACVADVVDKVKGVVARCRLLKAEVVQINQTHWWRELNDKETACGEPLFPEGSYRPRVLFGCADPVVSKLTMADVREKVNCVKCLRTLAVHHEKALAARGTVVHFGDDKSVWPIGNCGAVGDTAKHRSEVTCPVCLQNVLVALSDELEAYKKFVVSVDETVVNRRCDLLVPHECQTLGLKRAAYCLRCGVATALWSLGHALSLVPGAAPRPASNAIRQGSPCAYCSPAPKAK